MKCKKCETEIDAGDVEFRAESMNGVSVEIWTACPKCGARIYTFVDADSFTEDDDE